MKRQGQIAFLSLVVAGATALSGFCPVGASASTPPPTTPVTLTHTPGVADPSVAQASIATTICKTRYVKRINAKVTTKTASKVFAEYAIPGKHRRSYSIDHLIPIDLGGTNAIGNLWPIPLKGSDNVARKAAVDAAVHKSVCAGFVPLVTAQHLFTTTWPTVDTNIVIPTLSTTVDWFWADGAGNPPLTRFVVTVTNPGLEPVQGAEASWTAMDNSNALVGSYSSTLPPINALSTFTYVGGAGSANLTGIPTHVSVTIAKQGDYTPSVVSPFAVDSVQFAPASFSYFTVGSTYDVSGYVTIGSTEISSSNLYTDIILTNAAGQVVGGDFDVQPSSLPATLAAGLRIKIDDSDVAVTGTPTAATIEALPSG